jgi:ribonuclease HI
MNISEEVTALCQIHQVTEWDYMIVSDGSGTSWSDSGGWCAFLYDRRRKTVKRFTGGFSNATCHAAEYMPLIQVLLYLEANTEDFTGRKPVVVLMTDRKTLPETFGNAYNDPKNGLQSLVNYFTKKFDLRPVWLPGESVDVHSRCHIVANEIRRLLTGVQSLLQDKTN